MRAIVADDLSSERFHLVLDDLTACNVRDVAALQQLQARANSRDTARATASSVIGFSGFSVGQISTAFIAHRFGQRSADLATPFIGNLIFCHLSSINGDSVIAGRLGPKYDPTTAPFPVATTPHDRDVQAITADRPWILPTVTLTVTSAVALSFRLSTLPSVALSVASGLSRGRARRILCAYGRPNDRECESKDRSELAHIRSRPCVYYPSATIEFTCDARLHRGCGKSVSRSCPGEFDRSGTLTQNVCNDDRSIAVCRHGRN